MGGLHPGRGLHLGMGVLNPGVVGLHPRVGVLHPGVGGSASRGGGSASRGGGLHPRMGGLHPGVGGLHPGMGSASRDGGSASRGGGPASKGGGSASRGGGSASRGGGYAFRGGVSVYRGVGQTPIPPSDTTRYGQRVSGTHPTGKHSCCEKKLLHFARRSRIRNHRNVCLSKMFFCEDQHYPKTLDKHSKKILLCHFEVCRSTGVDVWCFTSLS